MAGKKKSAVSGAAPSQRMLRAAELIRHRMAEMLTRSEIHDDVLAKHVITVPEVRLTPDLKIATVYIMPLGGEDTKPIIDALARNKSFIRREIAHSVNLKYAPDLRFLRDETFDEAERITKLLSSPAVKRDLEPKDDDPKDD